MRRLKLSIVLLLFLSWTSISLGGGSSLLDPERTNDLMIGVKIYAHEGALPELFAEWRALGINSVFVSPALASQGHFRELALEQGIALFLILPIFYNPEELEKDPGLYALTDLGEKTKDDWVEFVCPTRPEYLERRLAAVKTLIRDLDPDGISLDFIRYFVFWEMVYPERTLDSIADSCFDRSCLDRFQKETGIKLPERLTGTADKARWIISEHRREWADWKCGVISGAVRTIAEAARKIKPDIEINIHTVPWREKDFGGAIRIIAGQDLAALAAQADMISPMCYWHMLKRNPPWIHEVVEDVYSKSKGRVIPSIQVGNAYLKENLSVKEFGEALEEALKPPSEGVIFWNWDALAREPEKKAALAAFLKSHRRPKVSPSM
ncbi:MAG TPA: hypothetical protein VMW46_06295 [Candidatus Desulfaltia sp.]|nr:hypothetical protein [Candidatus Desulfaltia sp.]